MYRHFNFRKAHWRETEVKGVGRERTETRKNIFKTPTTSIPWENHCQQLNIILPDPFLLAYIEKKKYVISSKLIKWDYTHDAILKSACLRGNDEGFSKGAAEGWARDRCYTNQILSSRDVNPPKLILSGAGQMELNHPVGVSWTEGPQISAAEIPEQD